MDTFRYPVRVTYGEVDGALRLTHRGAMSMMQEAAIVHSSQAGYAVEDVPRTHVIWMVVRWRVKLLRRARWNDALTVETWPRSMGRVTSVRNFVITGADGAPVALGESEWILVSTDTGRAARITPEIAGAYTLVDRDVFETPLPPLEPGAGEERCRLTVRRSDIDTNHHVNNLVYLDYALEALPEDAWKREYDEIAVTYRRQILLGETVSCRYRRQGDLHIVDLCGDGPVLHGTVVFRCVTKPVKLLDTEPCIMV